MKWETIRKRKMTQKEMERRTQIARMAFGYALDARPDQIQADLIMSEGKMNEETTFRCIHRREGFRSRVVNILAPYAAAYEAVEAIVAVVPEEDGHYGNVRLMWYIMSGRLCFIQRKEFFFGKKIRRKTLDWSDPESTI